MRLLSLCCVVLSLLAGCAPGYGLPPLAAGAVGEYRLGPGDSVHLTTFGQKQLTGTFRVSASGAIAVPLLGEVHAAGLTPTELQAAVAAGLKRKNLLQDPNVAAEVVEYRPIFVLGEVNKPGQYPYQPGMTVVTAVAVAGGFTYRAIQDYASVMRTENGTAVESKASREAFVRPGDVITVFERRF